MIFLWQCPDQALAEDFLLQTLRFPVGPKARNMLARPLPILELAVVASGTVPYLDPDSRISDIAPLCMVASREPPP